MATQYEHYTGSTDDYVNFGNTSEWRAETFTPSSNHTISSVVVKLWRSGSPGTVTTSIQATSGGFPDGSNLGLGSTIDGNSLTTNAAGEDITVTFSPAVSVSSGTEYAFLMKCLSHPGGTNYLRWNMNSTGGGESASAVVTGNSGASWADFGTYIFYHDIYGDPAGGTATPPSIESDLIIYN